MTLHRARRITLATAAVTLLALAATACSGGAADDEETTGATDAGSPTEAGGDEAGGESIVLAVSANTPFFAELIAGAEEAADEAGVELQVVDAQDDATTQANQIADAVTSGAAAIVVNPVDSEAAGAAVEPVVEAGIPLVAVDRAIDGVEVTSFVASDNVDGGRQAAAALAEAVEFEGQVLHLEGITATSASRERGQGFDEGLADAPGIEVVARQTANFDRAEALDVTTNLLQANPDVVGVFAENDEMALGAIEALGDRAGAEVSVVGFDGTEDALAAIEAGTMVASIAQLPRELGSSGVEQAVAAVRGEAVEEVVPVPVELITSENVGDFTS